MAMNGQYQQGNHPDSQHAFYGFGLDCRLHRLVAEVNLQFSMVSMWRWYDAAAAPTSYEPGAHGQHAIRKPSRRYHCLGFAHVVNSELNIGDCLDNMAVHVVFVVHICI